MIRTFFSGHVNCVYIEVRNRIDATLKVISNKKLDVFFFHHMPLEGYDSSQRRSYKDRFPNNVLCFSATLIGCAAQMLPMIQQGSID